jgi:hypothetical protein
MQHGLLQEFINSRRLACRKCLVSCCCSAVSVTLQTTNSCNKPLTGPAGTDSGLLLLLNSVLRKKTCLPLGQLQLTGSAGTASGLLLGMPPTKLPLMPSIGNPFASSSSVSSTPPRMPVTITPRREASTGLQPATGAPPTLPIPRLTRPR